MIAASVVETMAIAKQPRTRPVPPSSVGIFSRLQALNERVPETLGESFMEKDEILIILEELEIAFGDLPTPPEDRIVNANPGEHFECDTIRAKFKGYHWRELPADELVGEADSLTFLTPEAFRFFLPAFLRFSLLDPERADRIPDVILWSLAKPADLEFWNRRGESVLRKSSAYGVCEGVLTALVAAAATSPPENEARRKRCEILSPEQKRAIRSFVSFLRRHRSEEFSFNELDRVEEVLSS